MVFAKVLPWYTSDTFQVTRRIFDNHFDGSNGIRLHEDCDVLRTPARGKPLSDWLFICWRPEDRLTWCDMWKMIDNLRLPTGDWCLSCIFVVVNCPDNQKIWPVSIPDHHPHRQGQNTTATTGGDQRQDASSYCPRAKQYEHWINETVADDMYGCRADGSQLVRPCYHLASWIDGTTQEAGLAVRFWTQKEKDQKETRYPSSQAKDARMDHGQHRYPVQLNPMKRKGWRYRPFFTDAGPPRLPASVVSPGRWCLLQSGG